MESSVFRLTDCDFEIFDFSFDFVLFLDIGSR